MDMSNSVTIAAPPARVWQALNDSETLRRCIAGCESIEKTADNTFKVAMTVAIGPVKAKFKGDLMLEDIDAPNAYTIRFSGQGGVAGFGKGSARVSLLPDGEGTRLDYTVDAQVGGKIAQVGSRLIDGASKKMADDFFKAFRAEVEGAAGDAGAPGNAAAEDGAQSRSSSPPGGSLSDTISSSPTGSASPASSSSPASASSSSTSSSPQNPSSPSPAEAVDRLLMLGLSNDRWTWLAIAVALASTVLLMKR